MKPILTMLEPARANALLDWISKSEFQALMDALDKRRQLNLIESCDLQEKSIADDDNPQFKLSALSKLKEASELEITIRTLQSLNGQSEFIARIEL